MSANCVLIQKPSIDFDTFLSLSSQVLGYSPSESMDSRPVVRSTTERFLACLAGMCRQRVVSNLQAHVMYSLLVIADDCEMLDILSICSMPFVIQETSQRGVQLAVISGTLQQWRDAVKAGSAREYTRDVRAFFNHLMSLFDASVWQDFDRQQLPDKTLYLTYKK